MKELLQCCNKNSPHQSWRSICSWLLGACKDTQWQDQITFRETRICVVTPADGSNFFKGGEGEQQGWAGMWRNWNPPTLLGEMQKVQPQWKTPWCFLKRTCRIGVRYGNSTPRNRPRRIEHGGAARWVSKLCLSSWHPIAFAFFSVILLYEHVFPELR